MLEYSLYYLQPYIAYSATDLHWIQSRVGILAENDGMAKRKAQEFLDNESLKCNGQKYYRKLVRLERTIWKE